MLIEVFAGLQEDGSACVQYNGLVCPAQSMLSRLVHVGIRLPYVVCPSEKDFMLIDLESAAHFPFEVEDGFQRFLG